MRLAGQRGYLGIMICETEGELPFPEQQYYRRLCLLGERAGLRVYVFSPLRIDWETETVAGYTYSAVSRRWLRLRFPLPHLVYDRCFYTNRQPYSRYAFSMKRLKQHPSTQFLSSSLRGKWHVQQILQSEPTIQPHLPKTEVYRLKAFISQLNNKGEAFLKPQGGCQGRGILHAAREGKNHYVIRGRDRRNEPIYATFAQSFELFRWVERFVDKCKYLIQDYLSLTTKTGDAFDIRSLVQKNGTGAWQITGMAIRKGKPGSITSNLHGGGQAEEVAPFLRDQFGSEPARQMIGCMRELSLAIPVVLEQYYGRFVELGIDIGIDREGRVWLLEVNSKPGRSVFDHLNHARAKKSAVNNPIDYASYLLERQLGG